MRSGEERVQKKYDVVSSWNDGVGLSEKYVRMIKGQRF